jgi:hypothetical protein
MKEEWSIGPVHDQFSTSCRLQLIEDTSLPLTRRGESAGRNGIEVACGWTS